jgi:hypothetical protein
VRGGRSVAASQDETGVSSARRILVAPGRAAFSLCTKGLRDLGIEALHPAKSRVDGIRGSNPARRAEGDMVALELAVECGAAEA